MKKVFLFITAIAIFSFQTLIAQTDRQVSGFNSIEVSGAMDVFLTQGETESVRVEADADVLEKIITEVEGDVLRISSRDYKSRNRVTVHVTARNLNRVDVTGSGNLTGRSLIKAQNLSLNVTGSGNMVLDVGVNDLILTATGSGNMVLTGQAQDLKARITGSGDVDALKLHAQKADVHVSGSGNAMVNVKGDLTGSISGSGDIAFMGTPKINNINLKGSGKLRPANQ